MIKKFIQRLLARTQPAAAKAPEAAPAPAPVAQEMPSAPSTAVAAPPTGERAARGERAGAASRTRPTSGEERTRGASRGESSGRSADDRGQGERGGGASRGRGRGSRAGDSATEDGVRATHRSAAAPSAPDPLEKGGVPLGRRVERGAAEHQIDPDLVDDYAVRVVRTLREAGHAAYIVGGAVRDLLVGRRPKDFDVATDATPEEVKALFRRAFIIGRRFRIVHVVFGRGRDHEVIEVSTFRALLASDDATQVEGNERTAKAALAGQSHAVGASGRVLRDNVWGPQIEDAARRDFTINAMYYEPLSQTLVDYHRGFEDVRAGVLRIIGDAAARYREDPVRMIRATRFAAKLGFEMEPRTQAPIRELASLLDDVPVSRMFDEMVKLLQTGHALASVDELNKQGLGHGIFPILDAAFAPGPDGQEREAFVRRALADTDARVADGRAVVPSFLLASLLWHDVQRRWTAARADGMAPFQALQDAIEQVFDARIGDISGRGKLAADMREIWQMQPRFERRTPASAASLIAQPRYRAGFDFLRLRAENGEIPMDLVDWWEDYALGSDEEREALLEQVRERPKPKRVKKDDVAAAPASKSAAATVKPAAPRGIASEDPPAGRGEGPDEGRDAAGEDDESAQSADASASRRRRRRRRGGRNGASRSEASDSGYEQGGGAGGDGDESRPDGNGDGEPSSAAREPRRRDDDEH